MPTARYAPKRYHAAPTHTNRSTQFLQALLVASLLACAPFFFGLHLLASVQANQPQTKVAGVTFTKPPAKLLNIPAPANRLTISTPIFSFPEPAPNNTANFSANFATPTPTPTPTPTNTPLPQNAPTPQPTPQLTSAPQKGCSTIPFPNNQSASSIIAQFQSNWHINLRNGSQDWSDSNYHQLLGIWWQTINLLACTPYLSSLLGGHTLTVTANDLGMWWGQYDGAYQQEINIANQNQSLWQPSHIQQNIVHELTHVWRDTHFNDTYQTFANQICGQGNPNAYITNYGAINCSEDLSEAVGYYVIRQATEWQTSSPYCSSKNPYDWGQGKTYNWIKTNFFNNQQFGPPPPSTPTGC